MEPKEAVMKSLDELRAEHDGIKVMLNILSAIITQAEQGRKINTEHLDQILEFITVFVDKCHHGKEEDLLFPALKVAGVAEQGGPIGVMLNEHTEGRGFVQAMSAALERYNAGDETAIHDFTESAHHYINMLHVHIDKENTVLYPMAESLLSDATDAQMTEGFETIERERIGQGKHEQFHSMLHQLKDQYLQATEVATTV
jgi:hemerythrin-like domain-containing protein